MPGAYYQKSSGGGRSRAAAPQVAPPSPKKPGLFAPKGEKELYKAIKVQDVKGWADDHRRPATRVSIPITYIAWSLWLILGGLVLVIA